MNDKPNPWTTNADFRATSAGRSAGYQTFPSPAEQEADRTSPDSADAQSARGGRRRQEEIADQELSAIVGAGTAFHGNLSFSGHVRIDGEVSGRVRGGRVLVIGASATVQGEVQADRVIVLGGQVKADITARLGIELYVPAQVTGDLRAPEIHLDKGVRFVGTCDLSDPDP
jgi:cytoskeletal protein CcmA (bactofilin family)